MKQQVKVIKTQRDYDAAIVRLSALMDDDVAPGSGKEAELELLALVIESYERSKVEPVVLDPIEAILFRMDQLGLKKVDLVPYMGSLPKVSEVLARKRPLNLAMIRKLHQGLGIAADVLLAQTDDAIDLDEALPYDTAKFPLKEMCARGYFEGFHGTFREAKDKAEELIRRFMRGFDLQPIHQARLRAPMHQSGSRLMDEYALLTWHVAVLKKARQRKLKSAYVKGSLTEERLRELARLSRFEQGPRLAQEFLADMGIALVFEDHFSKTYLDGAAMFDGDLPVVALTLRHDRLDNFWFALLHELVHVQRHLGPDRWFIADNLEDKVHQQSAEEREADEGARDILIPQAEWLASGLTVEPTMETAMALADKLRIHPTIVAGRVRFEASNWRLLSSIKADVRPLFGDQLRELAQPA
ncbi:transcriptional regulator [Pseudorhodoferax sp. Leaf267]|uniref:transcriptional regulator n=1 Tax=Pseudorhodoferax sp. Leaf267 TaxID=1736316 RepID=UPI0006FC424E|nr:transcriptional regulator [Pseudorhodoferax sp. Leaf267]KQP18494.1 transcriptional regulator [Pseudorhodoferax sp. Leaf267]